jgi:type I restriction enzyme, S subunit
MGDVLLEKSGGGPKQPVGRVVRFLGEDGCYSYSNFTARIRPIDAGCLDPAYMYWFLHTVYATGGTKSMQRRSTGIRNLSMPMYKNLRFPIPPVEDQHRIVAKLDRAFAEIDRAIENTEQAIDRTESLSEAIIETELPRDVTERKLSDVLRVDGTITYGVIKLGEHVPDGIPCLRTSNVRRLRIATSDVKRIAPSLSNEYSRTILRGGEVLVNVRGTLGGVAVVPPDFTGWNVSREVAVVPTDTDKVEPDFVAYMVASRRSQLWLTGVLKGAAYRGINLSDLRELPIADLSIETQRHIVNRIDSQLVEVRHMRNLAEQKLTALRALKQSILAETFSFPEDASA